MFAGWQIRPMHIMSKLVRHWVHIRVLPETTVKVVSMHQAIRVLHAMKSPGWHLIVTGQTLGQNDPCFVSSHCQNLCP